MIGCYGAQIKLRVKSAIQFPANDSLERDIAELQSKTWKLGRKGVAGAKSGRKAYDDSRRAPPYGAGQHLWGAPGPARACSYPKKEGPGMSAKNVKTLRAAHES